MEHAKENIISSLFGTAISNGEEKLYHCPKCGHTKRKLSLNLKKNVFKCWICDFSGNDIGFLVKRYGNSDQYLEWARASRVRLSTLDDYETLFEVRDEPSTPVDLDLPPGFVSLSSFKPEYSEALSYLYLRGFSKRDILLWKIGYCNSHELHHRIVVPSFDSDGNMNYYIARSYRADVWPKYKNPKSSKDIIFCSFIFI